MYVCMSLPYLFVAYGGLKRSHVFVEATMPLRHLCAERLSIRIGASSRAKSYMYS